jgi:hypothetical protein
MKCKYLVYGLALGFLGIPSPSAYAAPLPYGEVTCKSGYVWREAHPTDYVCVTPEIRSQTAYDNRQASNRRSPTGGPYGRDTCKQGYVWRDAFPGDHVCVTPETRSQAADDNAHAEERYVR